MFIGTGHAEDFIISTPTFATNGGFDINDDDTLTIVQSDGSITVNEVGGIGVRAGSRNAITNFGSITASSFGMLAEGDANMLSNSATGTIAAIFGLSAVGAGNTLRNSGTIAAEQTGLVSFGDGNTLSNSGTIAARFGLETSGDGNTLSNSGTIAGGGIGLDAAGDRNTLINSATGTIATFLGLAAVGDGNTLSNSGSITPGQTGLVSAGDGNTLSNSGSIASGNIGLDAFGDGNTLINSGSISTDFIGLQAVGAGNTLSNSGTITAGDEGLFVEGDGNTLINSGTIAGGGVGLDAAGDGNTLSNFGTITAEDEGLQAEGDGNTLINSGTIAADVGLSVRGDKNTLSNSGSIEAVFGLSSAQGDGNTLSNSGSIEAAIALSSAEGDGNTLINSGTIAARIGVEAFGAGNALINSGTITGSGDSAGLSVTGNANTLANSGGIEAGTGLFAFGNANTLANFASIEAGTGLSALGNANTLTNFASVTAERTGLSVSGDGNVITNYGRVSAAEAFSLSGTGNTLNLLAPSFIDGRIDLGTDTTVNITTGVSHSVLWQFDGTFAGGAPNVTGPAQFFFNADTRQFATLDPTGFAAAIDSLGDMTSQVSNVGAQGLSGRLSSAHGSVYGLKDGAGDPAIAYGRSLWVTPFGGKMEHKGDDSTLDRSITQAGVALGYRWQQQPDLGMGVMAGYVRDDSKTDGRGARSHEGEADGFFAGLNGRKQWGSLFLDFALVGGFMSHEQDRFVNDNLASLGTAFANASYNSRFISPEAGLSLSLDVGNGFSLAPGAKLRYAAQWLDGYTETGSSANAAVADRLVGLLEASAEIAATQRFDFGSVTGRLGILSRSSVGDDDVAVSLVGVSNALDFGTGDDIAGYVGLGATFNAGDTLKLQFDGQAVFGEDATGLQGLARVIQQF